MKPSTLDPTAGERARRIRAHPWTDRLIPDPTDPRCGRLSDWENAREPQRIVDPTDANHGRPAT